jgi:putative heme-binding domain-containing protein
MFMTKNSVSVLVLLLSGMLFVGLSVAVAVSIVSTPVTIQVVAPVLPGSGGIGSINDQNSDPSSALLAVAQDSTQTAVQREEAVQALAALPGGDVEKGKLAFKQHCSACHKVHGEGADIAPELSDVASRLTREKIVESIVNPSAVVEEKYKTTMILTLEGDVITGLLIEKSEDSVKIFDSKVMHEIDLDDIDEMQTKNQSSMPEKLPDAMAAGEFLALVEYLAGLKKLE